MVGALVLLIMAASGLGRLPPSVADIVEVNHVMRDNGEFIQVCELDWIVDDRSYHYQNWLLVHDWHRIRGGISVTDERGRVWIFRARIIRETWTHYDPEMVDRNAFPEKYRRAHR